MINTVVFDYGAVLVDWNPHYVYDPWFKGDVAKADWFLKNICTMDWNGQMDAGKPFAEGIAELAAQYPEWKTEIELFYNQWFDMISPIPIAGMTEYVKELKARGFKLYGLSNWSSETFPMVRPLFEVFDVLDGMVVSGYEGFIKPDPRLFRILFDRYRLNPAECVFIDDNLKNVEGARAVGMNAIQFTTKEDLLGPLESLLSQK